MLVEIELPSVMDGRLQHLLDRQDREGKLSPQERREAEALADLSEMLSLVKLQTNP